MATQAQQALIKHDKHAVGNLNSIHVKTVAHGAIFLEDVDNFTLVELGFNAEGERTAKQLSDKAKKGYLAAAPERRYLDEELSAFYNAEGERGRIVIFEEGYTRFDTSAFKKNDGVDIIGHGMVAHFDIAEKVFIVSKADAPHADYAGSRNKFLVVANEEDLAYTHGQPIVRLEVEDLSPVAAAPVAGE
ncbi:hypothetical protein SAMN05421503_1434 [Terribacillus aidingensis]|uniref:Uncharacterized protein n=1 Tax=Terribacillus aidingensis TaxID=586416 RepID=A0A285NKD4_9BACI|nr:hypothetical protein [Terribacillus aidingensis]SNZ09952.1 hypothetical protein SAMN05421503_1434 [Terribacillus aidingensis]